jgi:hypothetical protein
MKKRFLLNKPKLKIITVVALALLSCRATGQLEHLKSEQEARALSKKVALLFEEQKIPEAMDAMEKHWPMPANELDNLEEQTLKYSNVLLNRFGAIIGSEKIKEQTINDFAMRETYVLRYEYSAIRLIFVYLKNDQGWVVNSFKWDDSIEEAF